LGSCDKGCRQIREDEFSHAQNSCRRYWPAKAAKRRGEKCEGKNGKERTKEEPADEEFFGTIEYRCKAKKQSREIPEHKIPPGAGEKDIFES